MLFQAKSKVSLTTFFLFFVFAGLSVTQELIKRFVKKLMSSVGACIVSYIYVLHVHSYYSLY